MKASLFSFQRIAVLVTCAINLLAICSGHAATVSWTGASGVDTNWSTAANWTGGTPSGNDLKFYIAGGASATNTVNTVVDASVTIGSLQFANTNFNIPPTNAHTLFIASGQVLNITGTGGLICGTLTDAGNTNYIYNSIAGPGALYVSNSAAIILVDQGKSSSGGATQRATLDLAGLDSFAASANRISVGTTIDGGANNVQNVTGTLLLARTNTITAAFSGNYTLASAPITNSIQVGLNNGNNGGLNFLLLGESNAINCDSIGVGKSKTVSTLAFNPAFTNNSPTAVFRGAAGGSSRVTFWSIGDMSDSGSSSGVATGTNDFTGGSVDALVTTMSLGRDRSTANTGSGATRGTLTFTAGTIDVNTLLIGNQFFSNPTNSNPMSGIVNVNGAGATLKVNTSLVLASTAGSTPAATNTSGTLNINGGTVTAAVITSGTKSTNSTINVNAGKLIVNTTAGTPARPITTVALTNSTLQFSIGSVTNLAVANLITGGTTNVINIASLAALTTFPTQVTLVSYVGSIGGAGYNFGLGTLPPGAAASLTNNSGGASVDLVVTTGAVPAGAKIWTGAINGNWDILTTTNWSDPSLALPLFQDGDFVLFNDSATGATNVILTTTLTPGSTTVSNVTKNYSFSGSGHIAGAGGLTKLGAGSLTIVGDQTYTGGTSISNGVLQLGDGTGANGSVVGNITNLAALTVANPSAQTLAGAIIGTGSVSKSGAGTLTLSGASTYTGGTTVSAGTLQVGNGATAGSITGNVTDDASLAFSRSDNNVFGGVIAGAGAVTKSGSGTLVFSAANSYAGGTTNSAGILVLSNNVAAGSGTVTYLGGAVQVAPGFTITNTFSDPSSTSDSMMDCSATGTGTWAGDIVLQGGASFRPSGINGTLDLAGNGALGARNFIIPRGTVEIVSNANFSASGNATSFGRNSSGNSVIVRIKNNAVVTLGPLSLGGTLATGGSMSLTVQDSASLTMLTNDMDLHNSTAAAATSSVNLNGGTTTVKGFIKTQTGGGQLATLNLNSGTLAASTNNISFLPALSGLTAQVRAGGAIINDNGFTVAIAAPLIHEAALGGTPDGGLIKSGTGTLALNGINTYTGPTLVTAGTLGGTGLITGTLTVSNAVLAPGNSIGTLTVTNDLTFQSGSTNLMEINLDSLTNDQLIGISNLTYAGTLVISNVGVQTITNGSAFKLFTAATYTGAFASIVPAVPDVGLVWNTNTLATDGTLRVDLAVTGPDTTRTNIVASFGGGNVTITWPTNHIGWTLQTQTNSRSIGLKPATNAWFDVAGSVSTNQMVLPTSIGNPTVFYRLHLFIP